LPRRDGEEAGAVVGWGGGKVPCADGVARCACLRGLWVWGDLVGLDRSSPDRTRRARGPRWHGQSETGRDGPTPLMFSPVRLLIWIRSTHCKFTSESEFGRKPQIEPQTDDWSKLLTKTIIKL
jgi:hypothetical protein